MHFNFSPKRDKFASTFGDVRGVLLRSPRIFVGGNSGIVAPCELSFGEVIPAGTVLRQGSGAPIMIVS
jgi:bifunctional UDP-N-acetylglucosamine pyrophosphorylase / glucosamine-1-phosphate N-acetyltransferase